MRAVLVCVLVVAGILLAEGGQEFCAMDIDKITETTNCMQDKIPAELKDKITGFDNEGLQVPAFIKKHCDAGSDFEQIFKSRFTEDEIASMKKAYTECQAA